MRTLIIGAGQIGTSLYNVLKKVHPVKMQDVEMEYGDEFEVLHICFPYSKDFVGDIMDYEDIYRPKYTVIHSTVPVGTSRQLQVFHSPVIGQHPNLEKSLRTFEKFLAPKDGKLKKYFEKAGIKIRLTPNSDETEALKLFLTCQFGISVVEEKLIWKFCKDNGLSFKTVYTDALKVYNEGYINLGMKNVVRPILEHKQGKIGGHCVIPNCDLLKHPLTNFLKRQNKEI